MMKLRIGMLGLLALGMLLIFAPLRSRGQGTSATYFYVVTGVDSLGSESANSAEASCALTSALPHCDLSWQASTLLTTAPSGDALAGYNVYRGTKSGGPYVKINAALLTTLTDVDQYSVPNPPSGLL